MGEQRSRRDVLGLLGSGCLVGAAGCLGGGESVSVLSAGSLAATFEDHVGPAFGAETGISVSGEYHGSNAVMQMVEDGTKHPDVVVSADATLLRDRLVGEYTDWDVEFATNVIGIGYAPDTAFGAGLEAGQAWYDLLLNSDEGDVVVSNPDLDPLGYRAWQAFALAAREHGLEGFQAAAWEVVAQIAEEPQLLAGVEGGSRAAAVVYGNMAVDHGLPFAEFPPAYNFAEPHLADHYATATYTTDDGHTVEGRPILYNATVLDRADAPAAGRRLVTFLGETPGVLEEAGLAVSDSLPRATGAVPEAVAV
jgi:molybdate/tungstate transport system substrate-binding protein